MLFAPVRAVGKITSALSVLALLLVSIAGALAQAPGELEGLRARAKQLFDDGKYAEALATQRTVAAGVEKAEKAEAGAPARRTAEALMTVAWYALFARVPGEALKASERAHTLLPDNLAIETNRAHALLLLGRTREAEDLYLLHKGKRLSTDTDKTWEDTVAEDFDELRAAGVVGKGSPNIVAQLGIPFPELTAEVSATRGKVKKLLDDRKYGEAAAAAETLVTLTRKRYGEHRTEFAEALSDLALSKEGLNLKSDAEALHKRSIAIIEKALGSDSAGVAMSLNNLALFYWHQGRPAEAEPLVRRSLGIFEKALGSDHPAVASALGNLAELCRDQGRLAEAEPLYQRSLAIREKALGPDHRDVGTSLNSLAELYRAQGRTAEAEPLYKRSRAIREKGLLGFGQLNGLAEKDPNKCAFVNLAHLYLRCVNFQTQMIFELEDLRGSKNLTPEYKAVLEPTLEAIKQLQIDFLGVAVTAYVLAGRKLDDATLRARQKLDRPAVESALKQALKNPGTTQGGRQATATPHLTELCSMSGLGAEAKDNKKIEERRAQLIREAEQLVQSGRPCVK